MFGSEIKIIALFSFQFQYFFFHFAFVTSFFVITKPSEPKIFTFPDTQRKGDISFSWNPLSIAHDF